MAFTKLTSVISLRKRAFRVTEVVKNTKQNNYNIILGEYGRI